MKSKTESDRMYEGAGIYGTHWQDRLQKQIQTCDAYVLIMSKNARASRWVPDELVAAKVSSNTFKSLADSVTAKKASKRGKRKPKPVRKKKK